MGVSNHLLDFLNSLSLFTGGSFVIFCSIFALFLFSRVSHRVSWTAAALIPLPLSALIYQAPVLFLGADPSEHWSWVPLVITIWSIAGILGNFIALFNARLLVKYLSRLRPLYRRLSISLLLLSIIFLFLFFVIYISAYSNLAYNAYIRFASNNINSIIRITQDSYKGEFNNFIIDQAQVLNPAFLHDGMKLYTDLQEIPPEYLHHIPENQTPFLAYDNYRVILLIPDRYSPRYTLYALSLDPPQKIYQSPVTLHPHLDNSPTHPKLIL